MKKWICIPCGYVFEGENPPDRCSVCGVGSEEFEEIDGEYTLPPY